MRGSHPAAAAHKSVTRPIGPAPQISVDIPKRNSALVTAARATLSGSNKAPSSNDILSGRGWSHAAGWTWYRVNVPAYGGVE